MFECIGRRCKATLYHSPNEAEIIWGFCTGKKGYNYDDPHIGGEDYLVFFNIEADDGTIHPGIFEDFVEFMGWYKRQYLGAVG